MEFYASKVVRFVSLLSPKLPQYGLVNKDGSTIYVYHAKFIRLLSEGLKVQYDVITPPDHSYGTLLPDGNWSGMLGMIIRSEADLAMCGVLITEDRNNATNFTYPSVISRQTFMTDKPQPLSKSLAIVYPFSYEIWIALFLSLCVVSFLLYVLMNRKKSLQRVMFVTFGSILQKSISFKIEKFAIRMLTLTWVLGVMILTYGYTATLLSFLSIPTLEGIRDISDLAKASADSSFQCFTYSSSNLIQSFLESSDNNSRTIGECLWRSKRQSGDVLKVFHKAPSNKAFIGSTYTMSAYINDYYISDDSFYVNVASIPFSRKFCCPDRLKFVILQITAAGLYDKITEEEDFVSQLQRKSFESTTSETAMTIYLDDISGAFYILISGWLVSIIVFFGEILIAKGFSRRH